MFRRYEQFSSVISGIYRCIQKLEREEMVKRGYKGAYAQYLMLLRRHSEGLTPSQICELSDKDKAAVSRMLTELTEKGLVVRKCDPARVYKAHFCLTEEGKQVANFVCARAQAAVATVNDALTEEERREFYVSLDRISGKLEALTKRGIPQEKERKSE